MLVSLLLAMTLKVQITCTLKDVYLTRPMENIILGKGIKVGDFFCQTSPPVSRAVKPVS